MYIWYMMYTAIFANSTRYLIANSSGVSAQDIIAYKRSQQIFQDLHDTYNIVIKKLQYVKIGGELELSRGESLSLR